VALGLSRLHGVLSKELPDTFILHLGSGGHAKVLAALVATFSTHQLWNKIIEIVNIHNHTPSLPYSSNLQLRYGICDARCEVEQFSLRSDITHLRSHIQLDFISDFESRTFYKYVNQC
jgi:hypothetical protein